jgi:hypothetical protein
MTKYSVASRFGMRIPNIIEPVPPLSTACHIPERIVEAIRYLPFGIEIEVENVPATLDTELWTTKEDGSLRNNGQEFVSNYGTTVGHFDALFDQLETHVSHHRTRNKNLKLFDFSERTSVHVHLDITRFTDEMVENLLVLYTLYEEQLFKLVQENRRHNIFCIPLRECNIPDGFGDHGSIWYTIDRFVKYSAINLACAKKFGTVEFRHHHGCMDRNTLRNWVMTLALLRYFAERYSNKELRQRVYKLKSESAYEVLTQDIFHGYAGPILMATNPQTMDLAVSDAKCFFNGEA